MATAEDAPVGSVPGGPLPAAIPQKGRLRFNVLGLMQIQTGSRVQEFGSPQCQAFMAVLLLQPGRAATLSEMVNGIWGSEPPDTAVATVRTHAWKWRRFLDTCGVGRDVLLSKGDGYRLALPAVVTDVDEVDTLVLRASAARARGRLAEAAALLEEALGHWYGDPLSAIPGESAERQRSRLTEMRIALSEDHSELQLALGRAAGAVPDLMLLTAAHPLRQRAHGLLMQALHATGRQAEALAVFQKVRRALAEEHGIDPSPELVRLHQQILAGSTAEEPRAATERSPGVPEWSTAPWPVPHQLPYGSGDYVGNEEALASVTAALLRSHGSGPAVVAVDGVPGAGKSALALRAARLVQYSFPAGVLYANLCPDGTPADPSGVLVSFLLSLGLPPAAVPTGLSDLSALFRSMTDARELLVVLDQAHDVAQVRPLLPGSPQCSVLLTSTARLSNLSVTRRVVLGPVSDADALGILASLLGRERVAADEPAALELVQACGRLPLVLHAVGDWLAARPQRSLRTALRQIHDGPQFLLSYDSVVACFERSLRRLAPGEVRAWARLASCGTTLTPASTSRALAVPRQQAELLLERLADASLLEPVSCSGYHFPALLRHFARHRHAGRDGPDRLRPEAA